MKRYRVDIVPNYKELLQKRFKELTKDGKLQWFYSYEKLAEECLKLVNTSCKETRFIEAKNLLEASLYFDKKYYTIIQVTEC